MTELQRAAEALVDLAGSRRKLAAQTGVSYNHICNICCGSKGAGREVCRKLGIPEELARGQVRRLRGADPVHRRRGDYVGQEAPAESVDPEVRREERGRIDAERMAVVEAQALKAQRSRRRRPAQQDGYRRAWIREHLERERRIGQWAREQMADPSSGG